jgi:hypothetical protein
MTNSLFFACHPERSEGPHTGWPAHTHFDRVINQLVGGPSPSARLGMTAY